MGEITELRVLPAKLRAIHDPPKALYVLGDARLLERDAVAIVGSRRATRGGKVFTFGLASDLAQMGLVVVSGLAYGIDIEAHRGALAQASASTIAVLGGGFDHLYPRQHTPFAREIVAKGGALVTEYAPDLPPLRHHFPARNRLISGLSRGVVVVEAAERSGSLITADHAHDQGREVMAVPGPPWNPSSAGCNQLIRDGAALISGAEDVLYALGLDLEPAPRDAKVESLTELQQRVMAELGTETVSLEALVGSTGLRPEAATRALVELELLGFVDAYRGGYIRRPL